MTRYLPFLIVLAVLPGCGQEEKKKDPSAQTERPKPKPKKKKKPNKGKFSRLAPENPTSEAGDVPVAEDFEEEAERTVAIENLEAELDRLEAEIVGVSE